MMLYFNVFNLPTLKEVVGQYKMWNEVKFWFTQMTFYTIYIPLIIRQANDLEENLGPTIFEVIDWTRTVCADYNQGNEVLLGENAGKQCVSVSLTAIITGLQYCNPSRKVGGICSVLLLGCQTSFFPVDLWPARFALGP